MVQERDQNTGRHARLAFSESHAECSPSWVGQGFVRNGQLKTVQRMQQSNARCSGRALTTDHFGKKEEIDAYQRC